MLNAWNEVYEAVEYVSKLLSEFRAERHDELINFSEKSHSSVPSVGSETVARQPVGMLAVRGYRSRTVGSG